MDKYKINIIYNKENINDILIKVLEREIIKYLKEGKNWITK